MKGIKGERCLLTAIELGDLERIRDWQSDPDIWKMTMGYRYPVTKAGIEQWYQSLLSDSRSHSWAVRNQGDPKIDGLISLNGVDEVSGVAELSIIVQSEERVGLATEAVDILCTFAKQQLRIRRIWLRVRSENQRAMKLYERAGFHEEGALRQHYWADDHFDDVIILAKFL